MLCEAVVSNLDKQRVRDRIRVARGAWRTYAPLLDWFLAGLDDLEAVPSEEIPDDVITMNSSFALRDLRSNDTTCYTLVYPEEESLECGRLCVLSPMGMALLGARVGDTVHWDGAAGPGSAQVMRLLYQPEAAGEHHL